MPGECDNGHYGGHDGGQLLCLEPAGSIRPLTARTRHNPNVPHDDVVPHEHIALEWVTSSARRWSPTFPGTPTRSNALGIG
jgi:hypothetical protein